MVLVNMVRGDFFDAVDRVTLNENEMTAQISDILSSSTSRFGKFSTKETSMLERFSYNSLATILTALLAVQGEAEVIKTLRESFGYSTNTPYTIRTELHLRNESILKLPFKIFPNVTGGRYGGMRVVLLNRYAHQRAVTLDRSELDDLVETDDELRRMLTIGYVIYAMREYELSCMSEREYDRSDDKFMNLLQQPTFPASDNDFEAALELAFQQDDPIALAELISVRGYRETELLKEFCESDNRALKDGLL